MSINVNDGIMCRGWDAEEATEKAPEISSTLTDHFRGPSPRLAMKQKEHEDTSHFTVFHYLADLASFYVGVAEFPLQREFCAL